MSFELWRVISVADHIEVAVTEDIEAGAEDCAVKVSVLREDINFTVRDDGTREEQFVPCFVTKVMHGFRLCGSCLFHLVSLICDDEVGIKGEQVLFDSPGGLIVDDGNLQSFGSELCKLVRLVFA